jgi:hypothetical protein
MKKLLFPAVAACLLFAACHKGVGLSEPKIPPPPPAPTPNTETYDYTPKSPPPEGGKGLITLRSNW